jgi:hypothetical protein
LVFVKVDCKSCAIEARDDDADLPGDHGAFVFSLAVTLGYPGEELWWELASLVTIMLLGH